MEMVKKTPSTFEEKGNNTSQPLDKGAMGVAFESIEILQRTKSEGNPNTMKGISGNSEEE